MANDVVDRGQTLTDLQLHGTNTQQAATHCMLLHLSILASINVFPMLTPAHHNTKTNRWFKVVADWCIFVWKIVD